MYKLLRHQAGTHPNIVSLLHVEVNPGLQSTNAFGPDWAGCAPPNTTTTSHFKFGSPRPSVEEGQPTSPNRATSLFRLAASAMGPLAGRQSLDERGPEALQREREMRRAAHPARASVDVPSLSRYACPLSCVEIAMCDLCLVSVCGCRSAALPRTCVNHCPALPTSGAMCLAFCMKWVQVGCGLLRQ